MTCRECGQDLGQRFGVVAAECDRCRRSLEDLDAAEDRGLRETRRMDFEDAAELLPEEGVPWGH